MALRQEHIEANGEIYLVRELSARELIPLIERANVETEDDAPKPSYAELVFMQAVSLDGASLSLDEVSGTAYLKLLPIVMRMNGMRTTEEQAGNA